MSDFLIAPSILSADFTILGQEIKGVEEGGADWIHVDVMDGHFVPNITMGPLVVKAAKRTTSLPLDVHLMISNPAQYIKAFADAGADWISIHVEVDPHLHRSIDLIKASGARAGAVLNPATPLSTIEWILSDLDYVLLMSVNPGFGGQSFIADSLHKIRRLRQMIDDAGLPTLIQVDGGVNDHTIQNVAQAGAHVLVAGSAIFGQPSPARAIANFRTLLSTC